MGKRLNVSPRTGFGIGFGVGSSSWPISRFHFGQEATILLASSRCSNGFIFVSILLLRSPVKSNRRVNLFFCWNSPLPRQSDRPKAFRVKAGQYLGASVPLHCLLATLWAWICHSFWSILPFIEWGVKKNHERQAPQFGPKSQSDRNGTDAGTQVSIMWAMSNACCLSVTVVSISS